MRTYAESLGQKPFDWLEFLNKKTYTDQELFSAVMLAELWPTCACGNQCASLPRTCAGGPMDDRLAELGVLFYHFIKEAGYYHRPPNNAEAFWHSIAEARRVFLAIEFRSAQLLAEMKEWDASFDWLDEEKVSVEKELVY